MRTDAAACPARRGQAQGLRPWEPRQRRCLYTPQGASRPLTQRLAAEENAWRDSEGWGVFSVAQRKVFFHFTSERTSFAQPPHQSKVLGGREEGGRGRGSPSSEGFPLPRLTIQSQIKTIRPSIRCLPTGLWRVRWPTRNTRREAGREGRRKAAALSWLCLAHKRFFGGLGGKLLYELRSGGHVLRHPDVAADD